MNLPFSNGRQWPDEHFEALKSALAAGLTSSQIAKRLNRRFGTAYTRNAVIGIVHRHVPKSERPGRASAPPKPAREPRPQAKVFGATKVPTAVRVSTQGKMFEVPPAQALPEPAKVDTQVEPRPWLTRQFGECAYPVSGEGADVLSCCAKCEDGFNYCPPHWRATHHKAATPAQIKAAKAARERMAKFLRASMAA